MRDIGTNIRAARNAKGLTQDELAEKLFVTRQTVSIFQGNYILAPSIRHIAQLSSVTRLIIFSMIYLFIYFFQQRRL